MNADNQKRERELETTRSERQKKADELRDVTRVSRNLENSEDEIFAFERKKMNVLEEISGVYQGNYSRNVIGFVEEAGIDDSKILKRRFETVKDELVEKQGQLKRELLKIEDKEYRVQLWKGSYGLETAYGGELGIYYRDVDDAKTNPYHEGKDDSKFIWYECADESYQWKSVSTIYDKKTNDKLISNDTREYAKNDDHFWNLAIKTDPMSGYEKDDLYMVEVIEIPDLNVRNDFVTALEKEKVVTNVVIEGNKVSFSWGN
ncbi:DUF4474 domain-containing protein [Listeria seeligeri]|uniref:DUF4474 domain-containing protein n=1 Tax=Listeria seeligeri TaxID=1640 RepID=UPI001624A4DB|nr:DUF4474 domain-containing protein [Listeria seeligeri]MBC1733926.1 DUF4474 domain-containing protein [Listeria seeligeri]MBF2365309.1 DUF4474 domain-containing protein [Listeria seeligeri]MBF2538942.1 DUF4474 domain-containing protein [Listeria seeligeri]MBF2585794.1 DUF4474 domain-containing protein [Listeria seeligeri]MBF2605014.1 DUF4474 domain-containing protein [Listeria seeligeri]